MQCIIMPLYNACYDSCGCILCMQKINNAHVCTCVCVCKCVCVYMCIHNVHVCTCVCAWLSVCVCVHVHFAQSSYIQSSAVRVTIAAVRIGSWSLIHNKYKRAEKVCMYFSMQPLMGLSLIHIHQLSPGHVCIYDYIK